MSMRLTNSTSHYKSASQKKCLTMHNQLTSLKFVVVITTVLIFVAAFYSDSVDAAITHSGMKCGNKVCNLNQYCSEFVHQCEDCAGICDGGHNVDAALCQSKCQDYLHDKRFGNSTEIREALSRLSDEISRHPEEISRLQRQLNIVLILLGIILFVLVVHSAIVLARWCKGRGIVSRLLRKLKLKKPSKSSSGKLPPLDLTHANPNTQSPKVQLRIVPNRTQNQINRESTVFSIDGASTIQTVSTPISTRYPAEDSTLSYSYDNAALAITPTIPERPRTGPPPTF